ncbi:hypothetical protein [Streptomyces kronopolitis]|uniref:hypothetical protein n=1 Tax=Streptomyces kronopolitis TaxID=1612435 RepID=UPI003D957028
MSEEVRVVVRHVAEDAAAIERAYHRDSTSPLRPFRDHDGGRPFEIFHVTAAY